MKTATFTAETPSRHRQPARAGRLGETLALSSADDAGERTRALATALLEDARRENASDIHLDPGPDGYEVRFRIDGASSIRCRCRRSRGQQTQNPASM